MKISKIIISGSIIFLFMFFSCQKPVTEKKYVDVKEMAIDYGKSLNFISQSDFKKNLDGEPKINILDCREPEDYNTSCIPGAINISLGILEFKIGDKIQARRKILYVYSDKEDKSILAAARLKKIKYSNVIVIKGNWNIWLSSYPDIIEKEPNKKSNTETPSPKKEEGGCEG